MNRDTDPDVAVDLDMLTDGQVMERCRRAREAERQLELVHGVEMLGARTWSDEAKLKAFMHIFHPERSL